MLLATLRCQVWRRPPLGHSIQPVFARQLSWTSSRSFWRRPIKGSLREAKTQAPPLQDAAELSLRGPSFYQKVGTPGIGRQIFSVGVFSIFFLSLAAAVTTADTESMIERMSAASPIWAVKSITNADMKRVQNAQLIQGLREKLARFQSTVQQLPVLLQPLVNRAVIAVMQPWADASEAKRLCWKICLLNVAVWGAWRVKSWRPFMKTRFMHDPLSGKSYTLLTSAFSHQSFIHLLCNCLALESFGAAAYYYLMRETNKAEPDVLESTASYHFIAFFMTAAMFSGLVSHIVNAKFLFPRVVKQLAETLPKTETWAAAVASTTKTAAKEVPKKKVLEILPSLGASGAIYACVTMTALAFPDSQVALFIPPSYPINIQVGVGSLLLLDTIGILRGWRFFDHWAHLGGAAFGVFYYTYGPEVWLSRRKIYAEKAKTLESESES